MAKTHGPFDRYTEVVTSGGAVYGLRAGEVGTEDGYGDMEIAVPEPEPEPKPKPKTTKSKSKK